MNKKGYSALELLVLIIALGVVTLLTTSRISHAFSDNSDNLYAGEKKLILTVAKNYGNDIIEEIKKNDNSKTITVDDLVIKGYLTPSNDKGDYLDPTNNKRSMNDLNIKIIYDDNKDSIETKFVD